MLTKLQEQSDVSVEVLTGEPVAARPEDRLLQLHGPLDARHSAADLLLRMLVGEDSGGTGAILRLVVGECLVDLSNGVACPVLESLSREHGVQTVFTLEKVGTRELAVATTSGPLGSVAACAWEMMKAMDSACGADAAPANGASLPSLPPGVVVAGGGTSLGSPCIASAAVTVLLPALSMAEKSTEKLDGLRRHCPSVELAKLAAWPDEVALTLTGTPLQRAMGLDRTLAMTFPRNWCALRLLLSPAVFARVLGEDRAATLARLAEVTGGQASVVQAAAAAAAAEPSGLPGGSQPCGGDSGVARGTAAAPEEAAGAGAPGVPVPGDSACKEEAAPSDEEVVPTPPAEVPAPGEESGARGHQGTDDVVLQATGRRRLVMAVAEAIMRRMDGREC